MLSIDEAIVHAREVAEIQRKDNDNCKYKSQYGCKDCADYYSKPCIECAEEHEQLAEWLEELKAYQRQHIALCEKYCVNTIEDLYEKAIDDVMNKAKEIQEEQIKNLEQHPRRSGKQWAIYMNTHLGHIQIACKRIIEEQLKERDVK